MKKNIISLCAAVTFLASGFTAHAAKPVHENGMPFGNGFPNGYHYNLNILGKKDNFTCPQPEFVDGMQVYGNVIFIPRDQGNDRITILMESGKKGPKGAQDAETLEVTDWCTKSFPDSGSGIGDAAIMRLPQNDKGYAVYARITGKPGINGEPTATITPELSYVEDESGNDLILLGLVDRNGTAKFSSDGMTLTRTNTDDSTKGKGVQKATNLTPLFEWTGEVCYLQDDYDLYCDGDCTPLDLCCTDADLDNTYESCDPLTEIGEINDDGTTIQCPDGYILQEAQCKLHNKEWVFNISDFVGYLWHLDSTGSYNIQVRFYPIN
jgi:hypothetical protein